MIAVDTNVLVAVLRGNAAVEAYLEHAPEIAIPFAVRGELQVGIARSIRSDSERIRVERLLGRIGGPTLWPNEAVVERFGYLAAAVQMNGFQVTQNDLWIAAVCVERDIPLLTLDKDFRRIPSVRLLDAPEAA